jgi:quercetin dioxygenase-like cupin family protein
MKLYRSAKREWTKGKGYDKRVLLEEKQLGIPGSFIQEVRFHAGEKVPQHYHERTTEVFFALDRALFEINGRAVVMEPEDVLVCEPGDVHGNPEIPQDSRILVLKVNVEEGDIVWLNRTDVQADQGHADFP